jgi:DNA-binding CsgD family transcriptional regulator
LSAERAGLIHEAEETLAQCLDPGLADVMGDLHDILPTLTRLALANGHAATAAAAAAAASDAYDEPLPLPSRTAPADHCRGLVAADPALLAAAADVFESAGRPFQRALALEDAAVLMADHGDKEGARKAFAKAATAYEALGARWDIRRAEARLRQYNIRRSRSRRSHPPAEGREALTPTETEIARLIASGLSNPDIAARLFLSRNTVQTHVSHILTKLGVGSRVEIARQVLLNSPAYEGATHH